MNLLRIIAVYFVSALCCSNVLGETSVGGSEGTYTLKSKLYRNPEVKAEYRVPMGPDGKPGPNAHNIVFYAPYVPEKNMLKKDSVKYFADKLGYTIFSFEFDTKLEDLNTRDKCYFYPEAGALDLVFEVQNKLIDQFKLPRSKLLIMGGSAGSTMAENLAVHYPDKVEAVAFAGGWRYDFPKKFSSVKWCVLVTKGDIRCPYNEDFCEEMRSLGFNMLHAVNPPIWKNAGKSLWRHVTNELGISIQQAFIKNMAEMRAAYKEVPNTEKWPLVASLEKPSVVLDNTPENLLKIPKNKQLFFPSAEFVSLWKMIPRIETISIPSENKKLECLVAFPGQTPAGVILCNREWSPFEVDQIEDDLFRLVEKGYVAITIKNTARSELNTSEVADCFKWIEQNPDLQKLNVYSCGYNESSRAMLEALSKTPSKNIKGFININSKPNSLQVEEIAKKSLKLPVLILLESPSSKKTLGYGITVKEIPQTVKGAEQKWQKLMEELLAFCQANVK